MNIWPATVNAAGPRPGRVSGGCGNLFGYDIGRCIVVRGAELTKGATHLSGGNLAY